MDALALYARRGAGVRLHTWLRAWTCPFDALFARLPEQGRLLEVGCGHGLFSHGARLARPRLEVLGVDPSEAKIRAARATLPRDGVRFELKSEGSLIDVEFLVRARKAGADIIQIGVDYFPRSRGVSTLSSPGVILTILREMLALWRELR